jgi:putative endonuclease
MKTDTRLNRTARGRDGEKAAALFLAQRGYRVLAANQRTPLGELDLICRTLSEVVVVEVKARSGCEYGEALEAVGPRKARRLRAAAAWWLSERGLFPCPVRFDVVVVRMDREGTPRSVQHLRNVLEP